ncbi:MAG: methyltransferase domain-containing protein [Elusimicrobia bacterium]|nr:methyltransferase domain-containing protein [Elusimicrobiota bacterium]
MKETGAFDPATHTAESRAVWNEAAERYAKLSNSLFARTAEEFADFAGLRKKWRVLDVACGPGVASRAAAAKVGERGSVLGVDLAPGMLAQARAVPASRRSAPIQYAEMDAHALPLEDNSFDAVISQLGLMLFSSPDRALSEMARAAKPGGVVACLVQGRREKMLFTSLILHALVECDPSLRAPEGAPTLYTFGPDGAIDAAFARAGLRELSTKRLSGVFRFASPEEYWDVMTEGAGRTGAMLRGLDEKGQAWVKKTVLRRAAKNKARSGVEIPYEFMMARGFKAGA